MAPRADLSEPRSTHESKAPPAREPWADLAQRVQEEVSRRPYLALLAAGGVGCFLAGGQVLRLLPGLLNLGVRVAVASALPGLTQVVRDSASPEL